MKDGDSVRHFRVMEVGGGKLRLQGVRRGAEQLRRKCVLLLTPSSTVPLCAAQSPSPPHDSLQALIKYHMKKRAGLTTTLKDPCPREQPAKYVSF